MQELQLKKVQYKKIDSFFDIEQDKEFKIQNSFSLDVKYADKEGICFAKLENKTYAIEDPEHFRIDLEIEGIFYCNEIKSDAEKQTKHIQIYKFLFPYAQMMIADLSMKAGLPVLMIEMPEMSEDTVDLKSLENK